MSKQYQHKLQIIGGFWRGRKISIANIEGLRPTTGRIRETLFNWLAPYLADAKCLDLFTGTGALGLEALSRGANLADMMDISPVVTRNINNQLEHLPLSANQQANVSCMDSRTWLGTWKTKQLTQYNIVFIDPPFSLDLVPDTLRALHLSNCLASNALIYVEQPQSLTQLELPPSWQIYRHKQAGKVYYGLIQANP